MTESNKSKKKKRLSTVNAIVFKQLIIVIQVQPAY